MIVRFRPLVAWSRDIPSVRTGMRFSGKNAYSVITARFKTELEQLQAGEVWIESGHDADDLRLDGHLKETAKPPKFPGVIVRLYAHVVHGIPDKTGEPLGPLWFHCATYDDWQDNLWAIAMTMERVRAITTYGTVIVSDIYRLFVDASSFAASSTGATEPPSPAKKRKRAASAQEKSSSQQKQSKATPPTSSSITRVQAARLLLQEAGEYDDVELAELLIRDAAIAKRVFIVAAKKVHPDLGGTNERMRRVHEAWQIIVT